MKPMHDLKREAQKMQNKNFIKLAKAAKIPKELVEKVRVRGENKIQPENERTPEYGRS